MSLRKAINEFCKWCIHDPQSGLGSWRQQVEACEAKDCPLWPVRPISVRKNENPGEVPPGLAAYQRKRSEQ